MIKVDDLIIYDSKECAEMLHVSIQTVRRYVKQGKLAGQKVGGKQYVTEDTIKEFLRGNAENDSNIY